MADPFNPTQYLAEHEHWKGEDGRSVHVVWQGNLLQVKVLKQPDRTVPRGMRQRCLGMSDASRWNLTKVIASIDFSINGDVYFLTCTYPHRDLWQDKDQLHQHRSILQRNMTREFNGRVPGLWRVEWKPRQSGEDAGKLAPHLHVITFGERNITNAQVNSMWGNALSWSGYVNTDCERADTPERLGIYIAKYVAKDDLSLLGYDVKWSALHGRPWGKFWPKLLPMAERREWFCRPTSLTRFICDEGRGKATTWALGYNDSFSLVGDDAGRIGCLFDKLVLDSDQDANYDKPVN